MAVSLCWIWAISRVAFARRMSGHEALDRDDATKSKSDIELASPIPNLKHLGIGQKGEALVPALVPPPSTYFHWKSKEKRRFFLQNNEYKWELENVCDIGKSDACDRGPGRIMHAKGGWVSNAFGKQLIRVRDVSGQEIFVIRREKHVWNPFQLRTVFRIFAPLPKDDQYNNAEPLFTVNRDIFGKGALWTRAEYRVYQGRVKDNQPLYYGISGYMVWSRMKVYKAEGKEMDAIYLKEKGRNYAEKKLLAAEIQKKKKSVFGDLLVGGSDLIPDNFDIKVYPGEDSALMLTLAAIWDMRLDEQQDS